MYARVTHGNVTLAILDCYSYSGLCKSYSGLQEYITLLGLLRGMLLLFAVMFSFFKYFSKFTIRLLGGMVGLLKGIC